MKTFITLMLLMVLATTAYGGSLSDVLPSFPMRTPNGTGTLLDQEMIGHVKWEVQGQSGDTVLLVGDDGETRTAGVGEVIGGCLVTAEKVACDPVEKMAIQKAASLKAETQNLISTEKKHDGLQAQLKKETDTRIAIEAKVKVLTAEAEGSQKRLEVLQGEMEQKSSEATEKQKQNDSLREQIEKLSNERAESELLADRSREAVNGERFVKLVDKIGEKSIAEELGFVKWLSLDDEVILQIKADRKADADAYLGPAVRQTIIHGDHVYYILERNLIDMREYIKQ